MHPALKQGLSTHAVCTLKKSSTVDQFAHEEQIQYVSAVIHTVNTKY